jgi:hypothetical protein
MAILVGSPETCSELAVLMIRDLQKFCRSFPLFARILLLLFDLAYNTLISISIMIVKVIIMLILVPPRLLIP